MSISNNNKTNVPVIGIHELKKIKFTLDTPFLLPFADETHLYGEKILRVVPGRRLVVQGKWADKMVVAKIFFHAKKGLKQCEQEAEGLKQLAINAIPSPILYGKKASADKKVQTLLFSFINHAKSLDEIWQHKKNIDEIMPILQAVTLELATQHVFGVVQTDLHFKNFLLAENKIYTLDGSTIKCFPYLLPKKTSLENLALFFSQFGVGCEQQQEQLFHYYAKARGWLIKEEVSELFRYIDYFNHYRWQQLEKKLKRESSRFAKLNSASARIICDRNFLNADFLDFLRNPNAIFASENKEMLKAGRSSTVIKAKFGDETLVIKRYNLKSFWHRLRRMLRKTRALQAFFAAQKLRLFGVATAPPVAYIENHFCGLRGTSFYITQYIPGEKASVVFSKITDHDVLINRITQLIKNITKLAMTHGDLKLTNILIHDDQPLFIDLDSVIEHNSLRSLENAYQQEVKRLLQNFTDSPQVAEQFKTALL